MRRLGERMGAPKRPKRQRAIWPLIRLRAGREAELAPCPSRSLPACVRRELYRSA